MNCRNCGKELEQDMLFCTACGTKVPEEDLRQSAPAETPSVPEEAPQVPAAEAAPADDWGAQPVNVIPEEKPKKKSRKLPLIIGGAVLVVLAVVLLVSLIGGGSGNSGSAELNTIYAQIDEDGVAYLPLMNGKVLKIDEEVDTAVLTADRKHVVVLLQDGDLYVTDTKLSKKTTIASDADVLRTVRDEGFIYSDEDELYYRVLFKDNKPLELGEELALAVADKALSVLYATDDGSIYTLTAGSDEEVKVGRFDDRVELKSISNDGKLSVWVNKDGSTNELVLNDGEERSNLGELTGKYTSVYVSYSKDQSLMTITSPYADSMWIKKSGEDAVKVKLGSGIAGSTVYTDKGLLADVKGSQVGYLYVSASASDNLNNVYAVTVDGERERILSKVESFGVAGSRIIYTEDGDLYVASLKKDTVDKEEKITGSVDVFTLSRNGSYVYFMKDAEDDAGTLYCLKVGAKEAQKVSGDAACLTLIGTTFLNVRSTDDGKTIFFLKNPEEIGDTYRDMGTLYSWSYGAKSATKLAPDVLYNSFLSYRSDGTLDPDSFMFEKYSYDNSDGIYVDWMYWNGKEAQKLASDVLD